MLLSYELLHENTNMFFTTHWGVLIVYMPDIGPGAETEILSISTLLNIKVWQSVLKFVQKHQNSII